jgi:hypothetical protein
MTLNLAEHILGDQLLNVDPSLDLGHAPAGGHDLIDPG